MSLVADHGRAVHAVRDDLAKLCGRIRGIQRLVPATDRLFDDLSSLRNDFCVCLATANSAVATLGALRVTGQAETPETTCASQLELHPRHHEPAHHYADAKCAAANDHD